MKNEGKLASTGPDVARAGRGRPTRAQSELRNEELLDRTLELFLANGFEGTTIEAITEPMGMSTRTVYARFGDKAGLFKAAIQRAIDAWVIADEQLAELETDDLETTLFAIAHMMVARLRSPAGLQLWRISVTEVFRLPEIGDYLWRRTADPTLDYLTDLFRRRLRRPDLTAAEARQAALAFLILVVESSVHLSAFFQLPDDESERQMTFRIGLFLRGARAMFR